MLICWMLPTTSLLRSHEEDCHEKNVSAPQPTPEEGARLSVPDVIPGWPQGSGAEKGQRKKTPGRVMHEPNRTAKIRQAGYRLRPDERLRRGSEYRQVYDNATSVHGRALVVFIRARDGAPRRAGFVAGRRVGGAVQRNRARRVLKEAWRCLKERTPETGFEFVFVARAPCVGRKTEQIVREMTELLSRGGALLR
jgi:ribonuclease P protein component